MKRQSNLLTMNGKPITLEKLIEYDEQLRQDNRHSKPPTHTSAHYDKVITTMLGDYFRPSRPSNKNRTVVIDLPERIENRRSKKTVYYRFPNNPSLVLEPIDCLLSMLHDLTVGDEDLTFAADLILQATIAYIESWEEVKQSRQA